MTATAIASFATTVVVTNIFVEIITTIWGPLLGKHRDQIILYSNNVTGLFIWIAPIREFASGRVTGIIPNIGTSNSVEEIRPGCSLRGARLGLRMRIDEHQITNRLTKIQSTTEDARRKDRTTIGELPIYGVLVLVHA